MFSDAMVPNNQNGKRTKVPTDTDLIETIEFSEESMESFINGQQMTETSLINVLFVGDWKTGKSGCAIDCRTEEDKEKHKKIVVIEFNQDLGSKVNKRVFHNDDKDIIVLDPTVYEVDSTSNIRVNYIQTLSRVKAILLYFKKHQEDLKAIVLDGIDALLKICEYQMKIEHNISEDGAVVSYKYWISRQVHNDEVLNLVYSFNVDRYFITHWKEASENNPIRTYAVQKNTPTAVNQIYEFTKIDGNLIAKCVDDRTSMKYQSKEFLVAKMDGDDSKWYGLPHLRGEKPVYYEGML